MESRFEGAGDKTYLVDSVTIDLADVVGARGRLLDHLEGHWREDSVLAALATEVASLAILHVAARVVQEAS